MLWKGDEEDDSFATLPSFSATLPSTNMVSPIYIMMIHKKTLIKIYLGLPNLPFNKRNKIQKAGSKGSMLEREDEATLPSFSAISAPKL